MYTHYNIKCVSASKSLQSSHCEGWLLACHLFENISQSILHSLVTLDIVAFCLWRHAPYLATACDTFGRHLSRGGCGTLHTTAAEDRTKEGIYQHSGLFRSLVGDHGGLFWIHLISPQTIPGGAAFSSNSTNTNTNINTNTNTNTNTSATCQWLIVSTRTIQSLASMQAARQTRAPPRAPPSIKLHQRSSPRAPPKSSTIFFKQIDHSVQ